MTAATVVAMGIDIGSATTKIVGIDRAGGICLSRIAPTEPRMAEQAHQMLDDVLGGRADVPVVSTGYGRKLVTQAVRKITEITCHARGVHQIFKQAGTLIDIGGQDSKVIALGPDGRSTHFAMNDKCAAGTGRFLEMTAARLQLPVERIGALALAASEEVRISSTCTVFAESEIISLTARGERPEAILRGLHRSLVSRVVSLVRSIDPSPPYMISGGVAHNPAVVCFLSEGLGRPVVAPDAPALMGAYGAALIAGSGGSTAPYMASR